MSNKIRNMSQWWFENKIGRDSQVSGKWEAIWKWAGLNKNFAYASDRWNSGRVARDRPAIIPHFRPVVNRQFIQKSRLIFGENVFGKNAQKIRLNRAGFRRFCVSSLWRFWASFCNKICHFWQTRLCPRPAIFGGSCPHISKCYTWREGVKSHRRTHRRAA